MLRKTLSAITAVVIMSSGLSAKPENVSKDMHVVAKIESSTQTEEMVYTYDADEEIYSDGTMPYSDEPIVETSYKPSKPKMKPRPENYTQHISTIGINRPKGYHINEPIRIQLKLKKPSYIYMWSLSSSGQGSMIFPNSFTGFNRFDKVNSQYVVPENSSKYNFVSDGKGAEENVFILATDKPISREKMESIFNKKIGNFLMATPYQTTNFAKDIHIIAKEQDFMYDIRHIKVPIISF